MEHSSNVGKFYYHYPTLATIVTSHLEGKSNALAVAWHGPLSRQPPVYMVAISPKRHSHHLIVLSREFTVSFVDHSQAELVARVGGCSGRDVDKFAVFRIEVVPAIEVKAPVLAAAYAAYECRVKAVLAAGDHDIFLGNVVQAHYQPRYFPNEVLDTYQCSPLLYIGDDTYTGTGLDRFSYPRLAPVEVQP